MCLAVAGEVKHLTDCQATVDIEGNQIEVATIIVPEVKVGDKVLVHAGLAIGIISDHDYQEHRRIFKELEEHARQAIEAESD